MGEYLFQNMLADQLRCLSLGARENRLPRFRQSRTSRLVAARGAVFPLPAGEGRVRGNETQPTQTGENASLASNACLRFWRLSGGFISTLPNVRLACLVCIVCGTFINTLLQQ